MKQYELSIFIFRRDYRLDDNIGLIDALSKSKIVIPIFIFTPEQLINNPYKSNNCVQFMIESLVELNDALKIKGSRLFHFFGKPSDIINKLISKINVDCIYVNRDYTPYSKKRDDDIKAVCQKRKISFVSIEDLLLHPVGSITNANGNIYSKFTPFFNASRKLKVSDVKKNNYTNYYSGKNKITGEFTDDIHQFYDYNENIAVRGGRKNGMKILNSIQKFNKYNSERNILSIPTTRLSAYIKFGCVSIREVYHKIKQKLGIKNDLIKQLYWREFYYNITEFNPNLFSNNWDDKNFKPNYRKVKWLTYNKATTKQKEMFNAWSKGRTGFPIIDACINELITTGFLHNRGRMIVASFLVKNLFFHWAEGEKFFSQWLVDLDLPNNNGGWGWVSSSGTDSQPFFRIFNPYLQSQKYDSNCVYIKKWLPILNNIPNDHIHEWNKYFHMHPNIDYPSPIIDYSTSTKKAIKEYKKALS